MRRIPVLALVLVALMVVTALPAGAAPRNGNSATEIELDCGEDGLVPVLVQFETGSAAVFDVNAEVNGRTYVLSELEDRIVDSATGELLAASARTWGLRKGYSETFTCTGTVELSDFGATWYGDLIVLKGK